MTIKVLNEFLPKAEELNLGAIKIGSDFNIDEGGTLDLKTTQLLNDKISNCILSIPQDINLTLVNSALTLKAGSKVYIPSGFESDGTTMKFDTVTISSDITVVFDNTLQKMCVYNSNSASIWHGNASSQFYSGSTAPTTTWGYWYDTANNIIKHTTDGSTWTINNISFPFCLATGTNGSVTSIDQVFNGFGYIGSTVFALPGVKGLIPNGRNSDGSLNNTEFTTSSVLTNSNATGTLNISYGLNSNSLTDYVEIIVSEVQPSGNYNMWYKPSENILYNTATGTPVNTNKCWAFNSGLTSGTITSFTPKTCFHALDYNDGLLKSHENDTKPYIIETYQSGLNWYRIWSDGWIEQGGYASRGTISLLKTFSNTNYTVMATSTNNTGAVGTDSDMGAIVNSKTTTSFSGTVGYQFNNTSYIAWYACGY